ncbi:MULTISPECIES: hypothetical protein [unclassified Isoptericola]|uniref:hypothetical protein n=1 Tax=unclassified Isoptericola TaxID=2623355 RepID=UPI002712EB24|nr:MULTISPECIES: hypothetical protein [unclassified Isoptericola]MDO8149230.1 hypothetical protein [Isoptericola sp. b515]MDO8152169.1 hypothetical protein [Isoptericola sp. b408]
MVPPTEPTEVLAVALFLFLTFWQEAVGLLAALVLVVARRRSAGALPVTTGVRAVVLSGLALALAFLAARRWSGIGPVVGGPELLGGLYGATLYTGPLIAGLIALAVFLLPVRRRPTGRSAVLARRTPLTFVRPWWFVAVSLVLTGVVVLTVALGLVSRPDDEGHYRMFLIEAGETAVGASVYGWYYSVPCLVLIAGLLLLAFLDLVLIARPAVVGDHESDLAQRTWRSRAVVGVVVGALLLHLSAVVYSLQGALMVRGSSSGTGVLSSAFAPLAEPLHLVGDVVQAGGWFVWFFLLLAALTARRAERARDAEPALATEG